MTTVHYHIVTLGCAKNVADSERIARVLGDGSHTEVAQPHAADVIIVNTCGFIDASKEESVNTILELAAEKRAGQQHVVPGCMTALHGAELQSIRLHLGTRVLIYPVLFRPGGIYLCPFRFRQRRAPRPFRPSG